MKLALLILLGATHAATAGDVQPRVFFAPDERSQITAQRQQFLRHGVQGLEATPAATTAGKDGKAYDSAEAGQAAPHAPARLDGISLARDGRAAAWIGGRRYEDGAPLAGYRLRISREGVRLVGAQGEGRLLKVGQQVGGVWIAAEAAP